MARRLQTSFSKGELSPRIESRPDLVAYFEGALVIENFDLMRQGGLDRRAGTRMVAEVRDSSKDTIILPLETSVDDAFIVEFGNLYNRFFKNKAPLKANPGDISPIEVVSPYVTSQLRDIHYTQSVDVMFLFHPDVPQQKLSHISDTNWTVLPSVFLPPPSFEQDTDVSLGGTLIPSATSGLGVTFTSSTAAFLPGDIGRQIIYGSSYAIIKTTGGAGLQATCIADIVNPFPSTAPIASGLWVLRMSPQVTLDPNIKAPVGAQVTLVAGGAAFRPSDVGKFITIYGGLVKITVFDSFTQVKGEIQSEMAATSLADPTAAPAGAWQLETVSWSPTNGYPATGEFYQGRLGQARTRAQPTDFWLSNTDSFDKYAVGASADRAVEYTIASRALNRIQWLAESVDFFVGTAGATHRVRSGASDKPIGGDSVPLVERFDNYGNASIQPAIVGNHIIDVDRSLRRIFVIGFDFNLNSYDVTELTGAAEHICKPGVRNGQIAYAKRPDPRVFFVRSDGQCVTLTFNEKEKVIGFTRYYTQGTFEAVAVIPHPLGLPDQVYFVVKRDINGVTKRFIEMMETDSDEVVGRQWASLQTDCAKVFDLGGVSTTVVTGLGHLEGVVVDVVADGGFIGTKTVTAGQITLDEPATEHVEVGLHYDSIAVTLRPVIEKQIVEGLPRAWQKAWVRLLDAMGGRVNGELLLYPAPPLDEMPLYTGDLECSVDGIDADGRLTIVQDLPYPMKLLAVFGDVKFGEHG